MYKKNSNTYIQCMSLYYALLQKYYETQTNILIKVDENILYHSSLI